MSSMIKISLHSGLMVCNPFNNWLKSVSGKIVRVRFIELVFISISYVHNLDLNIFVSL